MRRGLSLLAVALLAMALFYISPLWTFRIWGDQGLFGIRILRAQGDLVAFLLRGTPLAPYALLVWVAGSFLILTGAQWVFNRLALEE
ncbi:hypothetical protein [Ruegeria atlantica]|uniref:hypothetical protein n=1 Tax=Ruegeria atlantica TaxID=81569 RepID=UPI00147F0488|nr:hypothetical protein [Ruegeria atlantica]